MMSPLQSLWFLVKNPYAWITKREKVVQKASIFAKSLNVMALIVTICLALSVVAAYNAPFFVAKAAYNAIDRLEGHNLHTEEIENIRQNVHRIKYISSQVSTDMDAKQLTDQLQGAVQGEHSPSDQKSQIDADAPLVNANLSPLMIHGPPEVAEILKRELSALGAPLAAPGCRDCVEVRWEDEKGWRIEAPTARRDKIEATRDAIETVLFKIARSDEFVNSAQTLDMDPETLSAEARAVLIRAFEVFAHIVLCVFAWMMIWSGGFVGVSFDQQRSKGTLEPFACAIHPPWVFYGYKLIRACRNVGIFFAFVCLTAALWGLPLHWNIVGALILFVPVGVCMIGLWSMLSTVLFHHESGRMFARIALSPVTLLIAFLVRIFIIWVALKSTNPIRANAMGMWFLENGHWVILGAIPVMLAISVVLFILVNWRIGVRREGMRVCK